MRARVSDKNRIDHVNKERLSNPIIKTGQLIEEQPYQSLKKGLLASKECLLISIKNTEATHYQDRLRLVKNIKPMRMRWIMVYKWLGDQNIV